MNIVRFGGKIFTSIQRKCGSVRFYTNYPQKEVSHENWILFPREREGNVYSDNWSLVEHGVTPVGSAFKNGRLTFLLSKLPSKVVEGTVEVPTLKYSGVTQIVEAGDSISHEAFSEILLKTQKFFSSGIDLYFEDSAVVATHGARVGVRILSNNPAVSLVARSFMIPLPPRPTNHKSRFDGWKLDSRWGSNSETKWDGETQIKETDIGKGVRPVVAYYGGPGKDTAVQFVETNGSIVGANVVVGGEAPISSLIEAIGYSASVLVNANQKTGIALPSITLTKDKKTVVVIGADESFIADALASKTLFGAYYNFISTDGVSSFFNGCIAAAAAGTKPQLGVPVVVSQGKTVVAIAPDNMTHPATHLVFFEKGAVHSKLSEETAVEKIVSLSDESKAEIAKTLVKGVSINTYGNAKDILALL